MKKTTILCLIICLLTTAIANTEEQKTINVLINGASAAQGPYQTLPKIAEADGVKIHTLMLSPNRIAMEAILNGTANPKLGYEIKLVRRSKEENEARALGYVTKQNDRTINISLSEVIKERNWDYVILSTNTHQYVNSDIFKTPKSTFKYFDVGHVKKYSLPFDYKVEFFRKMLPNAKIILYQNFGPRNDSEYKIKAGLKKVRGRGILKEGELLTEDTWALLSSQNSTRCAEELDMIPVFCGDMLYNIRKDKRFGYINPPNYIDAHKIYDEKEKAGIKDFKPEWEIENDFRCNCSYSKSKKKYVVDHHPNTYGDYLTALLTYKAIMNKNITGNTYLPKKTNKEQITKIQKFVDEIVPDKTKYPLYPNIKHIKD